MKIAGAILAGGRSSRMGGNEKALRTIGTGTILDRLIARLTSQTGTVIINANGDPRRFAAHGLTVVPDIMTELTTPLAGIHASLVWAALNGIDWIVTVPTDTPFLPPDLVLRLLSAAEAAGAAVAASAGQTHFVIGAWRTSLADTLATAIVTDGLFRVKDWAARANAAVAHWPATPFDPFFNINTPEELAEGERIASEFGL